MITTAMYCDHIFAKRPTVSSPVYKSGYCDVFVKGILDPMIVLGLHHPGRDIGGGMICPHLKVATPKGCFCILMEYFTKSAYFLFVHTSKEKHWPESI